MLTSGMEVMKKSLNTAPIPVSEQAELIGKAKLGDKRAFERLLGGVFLYICQQARKYAKWRSGLEPEDLLTPGMMAVQRAVQKFDVGKGVKFLTYAGWWIRQYIRRYVQSQGLVRQPSYRYAQEHIAEARVVDQVVWMDAILAETGTPMMEACAEEMGMVDYPSEILGESVMVTRVLSMSAKLPVRERFAFESTATGDMTLDEAGRYLDLTRERVRQLRLRGVGRISQAMEKRYYPPTIWLPPDLDTCLTRGCGESSRPTDGGAGFRCVTCFLDFADEARQEDDTENAGWG